MRLSKANQLDDQWKSPDVSSGILADGKWFPVSVHSKWKGVATLLDSSRRHNIAKPYKCVTVRATSPLRAEEAGCDAVYPLLVRSCRTPWKRLHNDNTSPTHQQSPWNQALVQVCDEACCREFSLNRVRFVIFPPNVPRRPVWRRGTRRDVSAVCLSRLFQTQVRWQEEMERCLEDHRVRERGVRLRRALTRLQKTLERERVNA